jgi:hypothetical protein
LRGTPVAGHTGKVDDMTRHELNDVFASTSFLDGTNAAYLEQLYAIYQR